ncbi:MAG: T9SS type A sorting domain-containing protein [bacterium]|nr:T9SS type A sorting domain-containing protein [bacterium]
MMKKTLWVLVCLSLVLAFQVSAKPVIMHSPQTVTVPNGSVNHATDATDSTLYLQNFETGMGGWTTMDATNPGFKWHTDDFNGYQGTNSWWCADTIIGGYDNHWLQYLVTPALNFTGISNAVLNFQMWRFVETPGGEPPPYDGWDGCNVWASTNGGTTWTVITPTSPAYNCQNLYSFGDEWGMGPGIAGWGGSSGGWVPASFNLAALANQSNVKLRFAMCSDPAYCTIDDPTMWGFFVDNITVTAGTTTLLSNNADGIAIPGPLTFDAGGVSGDYWALSTASYHSPTHAMINNHGGHYGLQDALVSPYISIPTGFDVRFRFWLWCDMLDFDGDGNNTLEDYYSVESSTNGVAWTQVFYDYGDTNRPGGALVGWEQYVPGNPFNGNIQMALNAFAGQQVKLRFKVITDLDDNGGIGTGLHIDDFEVYTETLLNNDVGAQKLHVPFPTTVRFDTVRGSVELWNYGSIAQSAVPAFWRVNGGTGNPLIPWASIPFQGHVTKTFNWVTPNVGSYFFDSYTQLSGDQNLANDTAKAGTVVLTAADSLEFGYDNRQYSYEDFYYFNFDPAEGAYVKFTPVADGINFNMNARYLKGMFQTAGPIRIHIYQTGTNPNLPGTEVFRQDFNVTQVSPNWQNFPITGCAYLQNANHDFWVWFEETSLTSAPITGDDIIHGAGHFYSNFSGSIVPADYDFFIRAMFAPAGAVPPAMDITISAVNPPVVIPAQGGSFTYNINAHNLTTIPQTFSIWNKIKTQSGAYIQVFGPISRTLPGGASPSRVLNQNVAASIPAGTNTYISYIGTYPSTIQDSSFFTFTKNATADGGPWVGDNNCYGNFFDEYATDVTAPTEFALLGNYPNPFNPTTSINFSLVNAGNVQLTVYDVSGREVATLVNGYRNAGIQSVSFDASHLASGIYIYRLTSGGQVTSAKMVLMK